ncbi:TrbI/VirB10 family protein [Anabaena sp. PCC 7108]|uniref:TrbI/VirB10 family protein n=1 Tax=Anabaena sp. PCC 7108 TaxID=163908 RepID=UPI000344E7AA|nr:TrbI/VirB10 family protein [Anabaena sp. PCC 7108]
MDNSNQNHSNQNHEFDSYENSANYSLESHTNNGNYRSSQTAVQDEDISPEDEQRLAGYNPTANQLISQEYRLKQDQEAAVERPLAEKPGVRLVSVIALVGVVIASGSTLWFGFLQPKPPAKQAAKTANPSPSSTRSEPVLDESAELKSRLAFQDQQQQLKVEKVEPVPTKSPSQTSQAKTQPTPPPVRTVQQQTVPPRTTAVRVTEPAPVVRRYSSPLVNSPVSYTPPQTIQQSVEKPESNADALQQWNQLAGLGQSQISNSTLSTQEKPTASTASNQTLKTLKSSTPTPQEAELRTVLVGSKSVDTQADLTPGMVGILNRTSANLVNSNAANTKDVALGTSVSAKVIMPMIWDEGGKNPNDRFAVELTKPLKATDGTEALPIGTVIVAKTTAVGKKNNLVSATAIALVYPDSQGTVKQETIPASTLLIRGDNKRPLIAQKLHDAGSDIAKQDLLVGLLSSLGRVGSIVNQPRTQSSTIVSGGNFNQSTVTTNSDPQIWAAALEGFFSPVSERLSRRSDQAVQELLQRPNIQFLPEGTEVSVVVNNFLKVAR